MPLSESIVVLHPERAILVIAGRAIDIGKLCYRRRDKGRSHATSTTVDVSSLDAGRIRVVQRLIQYLSECQTARGQRPYTVLARAQSLVQFLEWADNRSIAEQVLVDKGDTESAFEAYCTWLREQVAAAKLNQNTAAQHQAQARTALVALFEDEDFGSTAQRIRKRRKFTDHTQVPPEQEQAAILHWCDNLFEAISRQVLTMAPYPFAVDGANVNTGLPQRIWMLPSSRPNPRPSIAWDLDSGRIRSLEELKAVLPSAPPDVLRQRAHGIRNPVVKMLNEANSNRVAHVRLADASLAAYCFACLFLAETGANLSVVVDTYWSEELEAALRRPDVVRQGFREVKYRANGKPVSFQVTLGFLPRLKTYLQLREYLLLGTRSDALFVCHEQLPGVAVPMSDQFLEYLQKRLAARGIDVPNLGARDWRSAKQDHLVSNHGPELAATILGHSFETAVRIYSNGTETAHRAEMAAFLGSVEKTVLSAAQRATDDVESAVGTCRNLQAPRAISAHVPVRPDCRSSEGCLFCDKYQVHADERDIRKLLSCRHCVRLTSNRAASVEQYEETFGAVLRRIDFLLDELRKLDEALVRSIEMDVDVNGNLDPFWAGKLDLLFELNLA